jgi:L-cysteine S-thiosulfotransferase
MRARLVLAGVASLLAGGALAQVRHDVERAAVEKAMQDSWRHVASEWQMRLQQDETQAVCSLYRNNPPPAVAAALQAREQATIKYPADGKLMGDWKKGEKLAQSGYGMRFTDYPPRAENGGNCFACHQLDPKELSYGTLGPSLAAYGKNRNFAPAEVQAVYERIYNPQAAIACANMPRLGANGVLSLEQIADLTAYVMSSESPVNK